jgi:hypothetical protein
MQLEGSCHCQKVKFRLESSHPYPFNLCYCEVCRKTAGGGGYVINLGGAANSLICDGRDYIKTYRAELIDATGKRRKSTAERNFCKECGSALWLWDPTWANLIHPFASAIDTELPKTPEKTHLMIAFKASWVQCFVEPEDKFYKYYPEESIEDWHKRLELER